MLRVTDLVLPLDHPEHALRDAVLQRLGAMADELLTLQVHRRGVDARKKSAIQWVYTVDVTLRDEPAALEPRGGALFFCAALCAAVFDLRSIPDCVLLVPGSP